MLHLFLTDRDVLLQTQVDNLRNQLDIVRGMFMNEIFMLSSTIKQNCIYIYYINYLNYLIKH